MLKQKIAFLLLLYFRELAKLKLAQIQPTVIGITGSAGKTSLLNAISAVLKNKFRVKTSRQANSESGIPLNILGLEPRDYSFIDWLRLMLLAPFKLLTNQTTYDVYVAELGVDSPFPPKNMGYLLTIVQPTIGVFLNVLPVHSQFFDAVVSQKIKHPLARREAVMDQIAAEKGKLIESLPQDGVAILNADDQRVMGFSTKTKAKLMTFATVSPADLVASHITTNLEGFNFIVREKTTEKPVSLPFPLDEPYAETCLAGIAVGRALGIPLSECVKNLSQHFKLPKGRLSLIPGIKGTTILDSSYNASRTTMESALKTLAKVSPQRRVAILGDMRELGKISRHEHEEIATVAAKTTDLVISVGPQMQKWFAPRLLKLGYPPQNLRSVLNPYPALSLARQLIREKDTILIKGSQNTLLLEIVTEGLLRHPKDADRLLCRRGTFWDNKRKELAEAAA